MNRYVPKEITEAVNVTPVHPLVNLGHLTATVLVVGALVYGGLGLIAGQLATRISPQSEEKIGAAITASLTLGGDQADSRVAYLHKLLLSLQADAPTAAQYPPLKVYILDTPIENAMVSAGSYLFVTEGLLAAVESENELAFVLAHELGHLQKRDPLRALGRSLVWVSLNSLLGLGQAQIPGAVTSVATLSDLSYSRSQETAADAYALSTIIERYPHGAHSLDFFERAQRNESDLGAFGVIAEWQQSHPLSGDRIRQIEQAFQAKGVSLTGEATALPAHLSCKNFEPCE